MSDLDETLRLLDEQGPAAQRRDPDAIAAVYDLTSDLLHSIALGVVRDVHLANDVVQDAFARYVEHCGDVAAEGRSIRAWLVRTTRNRALDIIRSAEHRRADKTAVLPEVAGVDETADAVLDGAVAPEVQAAFDALTEDQRTVLTLRHLHGLSGAEVGEIMGRTRAAVYVLAQRAERRMREALDSRSISEP